MAWHGMFRVVPFAFSVEKSTLAVLVALVTNHSYGVVIATIISHLAWPVTILLPCLIQIHFQICCWIL